MSDGKSEGVTGGVSDDKSRGRLHERVMKREEKGERLTLRVKVLGR